MSSFLARLYCICPFRFLYTVKKARQHYLEDMGMCIIPIMPLEYLNNINVWFVAFSFKNRQKIRSSLHRVYGFRSHQLHASRKLSYNTDEKAIVVIFSSTAFWPGWGGGASWLKLPCFGAPHLSNRVLEEGKCIILYILSLSLGVVCIL